MTVLLQGKRIFIVEDNPHNRIIFTTILRMHGAAIEFDRWGRDTLARLHGFQKVDLIVLDLMLPTGHSGYEIFDQLRCRAEFDATPIIAVSAAEPALAIPKTKLRGFAGFIAKPIDDELFPEQIAMSIAGEPIWYAGERFQGLEDRNIS